MYSKTIQLLKYAFIEFNFRCKSANFYARYVSVLGNLINYC